MTSEASFNPHTLISDQLQYGEKVLWVGKPMPTREAQGAAIPILLFAAAALIVLLIAMFVPDSRGPSGGRMGDTAPLMLATFAVITTAAFIFYRYRVMVAKKTAYGITNQRVVVIKENLRGNLNIRAYNYPLYMERRDLPDGKGDLTFTNVVLRKIHYGRRTVTIYAGLFGIDNIEAVERLILEVLPGSTITPADLGL